MVANKLDILKQIAGSEVDQGPSTEELHGMDQITKNKEFLVKTAGQDGWNRWSLWNSEIAKPWDFTLNNKEEYWDTFRHLWPDTKESGERFIRDEIFDTFKNRTPEEQEQLFRDKFRMWPDSLYPELEEHYLGLKSKLDAKQLEKSIVLHRLELSEILNEADYDLDSQVASTVHVNEWLRLYKAGLISEISVENGRFVYPKDGKFIPAMTLPEEDSLNTEEDLIYLKYLKPLVKDKVASLVHRSRETLKTQEKESTQLLANNINNPAILDEHKVNIIIDTVKDSKDPQADTLDMVNSLFKSRIEQNDFKDFPTYISSYMGFLEDIKNVVGKRLGVDNNGV